MRLRAAQMTDERRHQPGSKRHRRVSQPNEEVSLQIGGCDQRKACRQRISNATHDMVGSSDDPERGIGIEG
jgi:hypothetical protein